MSLDNKVSNTDLFHKDALFPLLEEPNVDYIIASCKSLSGNLAVLSNNDKINFDACVIW